MQELRKGVQDGGTPQRTHEESRQDEVGGGHDWVNGVKWVK